MIEAPLTKEEKIDYLCRRQYGIDGGGTSRMLFACALRDQPETQLDALVRSAQDEEARRSKARAESRARNA